MAKQRPANTIFGAIALFSIIGVLLLVFIPTSASQQSPSPPNPLKMTLPSPAPIPIAQNIPPPEISAKGVIVTDPVSDAVLYQKNPDTILMPASTTKIMTALVALKYYAPSEIVTITDADRSIGHKAEINAGEQLTVNDLLYALMLSSGNDAAVALAQHHPDGYDQYVNLMNDYAEGIHLKNTHFTNVSGIEDTRHYTTARDLAILTKHAMSKPTFAKIVATKTISITSIDQRFTHTFTSTNQLLGTLDGVIGVKTGWTLNAGECLVTYTVRQGQPIIVVVLNSLDRFGDSTKLIDWTYTNHQWMPYQQAVDKLSQN